jgi:hypothetical protein
MATATLVLKIRIKYELEGENPQSLKEQLYHAAEFLSDNGKFTFDDTQAFVDEWKAEVEQIQEI